MATKLKEIGGANTRTTPKVRLPRHTRLPQARSPLTPKEIAPAAIPIRQANAVATPMLYAPAETPLGGQTGSDAQVDPAAQTPFDDGQPKITAQRKHAIVGNLTMYRRRYEDLCRSHQRLELQAIAACRYALNGDKEAGAKLYARSVKEQTEATAWLIPYLAAMEPLKKAKAEQEKIIIKLAKQLPAWKWGKEVAGLSERFFGLIVGECGAPVGEFKSVSAVWKRMGLAVIDGGRQRKIAGDAAIEHGYVARRRSLMWNIGNSMIKHQIRKVEDGPSIAIGPYGEVYLTRKAYELTREGVTPMWAHNRAMRYMVKRLLRELYKAWRAAA